jgi:hypothetical protein
MPRRRCLPQLTNARTGSCTTAVTKPWPTRRGRVRRSAMRRRPCLRLWNNGPNGSWPMAIDRPFPSLLTRSPNSNTPCRHRWRRPLSCTAAGSWPSNNDHRRRRRVQPSLLQTSGQHGRRHDDYKTQTQFQTTRCATNNQARRFYTRSRAPCFQYYPLVSGLITKRGHFFVQRRNYGCLACMQLVWQNN